MIYLKNTFFKCPSQKTYDYYADRYSKGKKAPSKAFQCSCGHIGLHRNGKYTKTFLAGSNGKIKLRILQLRCPQCGHTHAVFLSCFIPYLRISVGDAAELRQAFRGNILSSYCRHMDPSMDEQMVYRMIKRIQYFDNLLAAAGSGPEIFPSDLDLIFEFCFSITQKQFLQQRGQVCAV